MPDLAFFTRHPLLKRLLMPAVAVIAFGLFLMLTFPYDALARRIEAEARRTGAEVSIGRLGPAGLFGVRGRDVKVRFAPAPGEATGLEIRLDRADVNPDLFALILRRTSFGFSAEGYGGTARGHVSVSSDPRLPGLKSLRIDARDIDLATLPLKDLAGIEASGKLQVKADLPALLPVETANGSVSLALDGGGVGGTLMGMTLPKTSLGHVDGSATVEKGVAHVEKTSARGGDIDADVDGSCNLRPLLSLSQADLHVRFRLASAWLDRNQMIKGMIGLLPPTARQGDGSYAFTFTGPLAHMTSRPGR
ncbi:MAG TPA: type II secretion system protein GspN [Myxococcales bacterium]|nr:type II secretion system protein GspN [Myxococcales bacterium]